MNDITILKEMLSEGAQIPLQQREDKYSAVLKDKQAGTTLQILALPHNSVVIRAEVFKQPNVFKKERGVRRRADFVIVSSVGTEKWIVCIETKRGEKKDREHIEQQLRGAQCFIGYCRCVGQSFWQSESFLDGYQYRFVSVANIKAGKQSTRFYKPGDPSARALHDKPDTFLEILGRQTLYFPELT